MNKLRLMGRLKKWKMWRQRISNKVNKVKRDKTMNIHNQVKMNNQQMIIKMKITSQKKKMQKVHKKQRMMNQTKPKSLNKTKDKVNQAHKQYKKSNSSLQTNRHQKTLQNNQNKNQMMITIRLMRQQLMIMMNQDQKINKLLNNPIIPSQ